jgi:hypothetical protein
VEIELDAESRQAAHNFCDVSQDAVRQIWQVRGPGGQATVKAVRLTDPGGLSPQIFYSHAETLSGFLEDLGIVAQFDTAEEVAEFLREGKAEAAQENDAPNDWDGIQIVKVTVELVASADSTSAADAVRPQKSV